jgi:acyl carrier protein
MHSCDRRRVPGQNRLPFIAFLALALGVNLSDLLEKRKDFLDLRQLSGFMQEIQKKITDILIQKFGIVESEITPDANLVKDLGIDSLDYAELVMDFEQTFDIKISDEDAEKMQTIGQAVKYIDSKRKKA